MLDETISEFIYNSASENKISDYVYKDSRRIFENGLKALENGETSLAEILRITED